MLYIYIYISVYIRIYVYVHMYVCICICVYAWMSGLVLTDFRGGCECVRERERETGFSCFLSLLNSSSISVCKISIDRDDRGRKKEIEKGLWLSRQVKTHCRERHLNFLTS